MDNRFIYNYYITVWFHQKLRWLDRELIILAINIFPIGFYYWITKLHVYIYNTLACTLLGTIEISTRVNGDT